MNRKDITKSYRRTCFSVIVVAGIILMVGIKSTDCRHQGDTTVTLNSVKELESTDSPTRDSATTYSCTTSPSEKKISSAPPSPAGLVIPTTGPLAQIFIERTFSNPWESLPTGVWYRDLVVGKGRQPTSGVAVYVHFRGFLGDGTEFANTFKDKQYFVFTFGKGAVLKGFEQGLASMREGGKRLIVIPPDQAYGEEGYKDDKVEIQSGSHLIFELSLLWIREPETHKLDMFR